MKLFFLILLIPLQCFGLTCPDGSYIVEVDLSFSGKKVKFCQKYLDGKLIKYGHEEIYDLSGKLISEKYFINNVEGDPPEKFEKDQTLDVCSGQQEYIRDIVRSLFVSDFGVLDNKNEYIIAKSKKGCPGHPKRRLKFFLYDKSFVNHLSFSEFCHFQGDIFFNLNKKIETEFKLQAQVMYDHFKLSYLITKLNQGKKIILKLNILDGEFTKKDSKNILKFSALQDFEVDSELILLSRGTKGFYSNPPVIKIKQLNEMKCM